MAKKKSLAWRADKAAIRSRELLRSIRIAQRCELEPGQIQAELRSIYIAAFRAGKREIQEALKP